MVHWVFQCEISWCYDNFKTSATLLDTCCFMRSFHTRFSFWCIKMASQHINTWDINKITDNIVYSKFSSLTAYLFILIEILLKFISEGLVDNSSALVQVVTCHHSKIIFELFFWCSCVWFWWIQKWSVKTLATKLTKNSVILYYCCLAIYKCCSHLYEPLRFC